MATATLEEVRWSMTVKGTDMMNVENRVTMDKKKTKLKQLVIKTYASIASQGSCSAMPASFLCQQ
jgi:hypothetical protein